MTSSSTRTILRDVSTVDTSVEVLGRTSALPFGIAPTGFTRLMHTAGERAGASAAHDADIPFALSTLGTTSIEDVAAANPGGRNWFQLYMWQRPRPVDGLVDRAAAAGFETLVITVDVPVAGARLRDVRNGLTVPPTLTLRTVLDAIPPPGLVVRLPHHRAPGLRVVRPLAGHGRRTARHDVRPDHDLRRPAVDHAAVDRQDRREGRPDHRGRPAAGRPRRRRHHAVQPRRPPARPGPGAVPPPARGRPRGRPRRRGPPRHRAS